jgi:hypothetical protein
MLVERTLALIREWPKPSSALAMRARLATHHPCGQPTAARPFAVRRA